MWAYYNTLDELILTQPWLLPARTESYPEFKIAANRAAAATETKCSWRLQDNGQSKLWSTYL